MLSQKQQLKLELYCNAFVLGMFADILNEQNRGNSFTWEEFPSAVASLAEASVFMMHTQQKTLKEAEELVRVQCLHIAKSTLKRAGYIT